MNPFAAAYNALSERTHARIINDVSEHARRTRGRRLPIDDEGYMAAKDAAEVMRVSEADLLLMARRGELNWRTVGSGVEIQPAIVSGASLPP
ncbi:MAG TPA: hypothetical protein VGC71_09255, partial [Gaiellales bacterium]|jgi:hypothetical protein